MLGRKSHELVGLRTRLGSGVVAAAEHAGHAQRIGQRVGVGELGPFDQTEMGVNDIFVIESPGGGGYGPP